MSSSRRALASSRVTVDISQALPSWKITRASWNLRPPELHYSFHIAHPPLIIPEFRPVPSWVGGGDAGASPPPPRGRARSSKQTAAPIPLLPQLQTDSSVAPSPGCVQREVAGIDPSKMADADVAVDHAVEAEELLDLAASGLTPGGSGKGIAERLGGWPRRAPRYRRGPPDGP